MLGENLNNNDGTVCVALVMKEHKNINACLSFLFENCCGQMRGNLEGKERMWGIRR